MRPSTFLTILSLLFIAVPSLYADEMLCAVNRERKKHGKPPLGADDRMNNAARKHSQYQAKTKKMGHSGEGRSSPSKRISAAGVKWKRVAENVAVGYRTVEKTVQALMDSPGHRANILGDYTMFGWAKVDNSGKPYWTQTFAKDGSPAKNVPTCSGGSSKPSDTLSYGDKGSGGSNPPDSKGRSKDSTPKSETCTMETPRRHHGHGRRHH